MAKKYKILIGLIVLVILFFVIFKKQLHSTLVYHEISLSSGCLNGFCVEHSNEIFLESLKTKGHFQIAYNDGESTKLVGQHKFLELQVQKYERLSLFKKGLFFTKDALHLTFSDGRISSIKKEYYGPFYFDL